MDAVAAPAAPAASTPAPSPGTTVASKAEVSTPVPISDGTKSAESAESSPAPKPPAGDDKIVIKVNGKLQTLTRDEAIRRLQKSEAAEERFSAAASEKKKVAAMLKALQGSDDEFWEVASALGKDPKAMLEAKLKREAELAQMTPEQRALAEREQALAKKEAEIKAAEEKARAEQREAYQKQVWGKLEADALATLDKVDLGGMSKAEGLALLADTALMNLEYGIDLSPEELAAEVQTKVKGAREGLEAKVRGGLEGEALLTHLGEHTVNAVLRAAVARLKGGQPLPKAAPPPTPAAPATEEPTSLSPEALVASLYH